MKLVDLFVARDRTDFFAVFGEEWTFEILQVVALELRESSTTALVLFASMCRNATGLPCAS